MNLEENDKKLAGACTMLVFLGLMAWFSEVEAWKPVAMFFFAAAYVVGVFWVIYDVWRVNKLNEKLQKALAEDDEKFAELKANLITSGCEIVRWNKIAELACSEKVSREAVQAASKTFSKTADSPGSNFIPVACNKKKPEDKMFLELVMKEASVVPDLEGASSEKVSSPSDIKFRIVDSEEVKKIIEDLLTAAAEAAAESQKKKEQQKD